MAEKLKINDIYHLSKDVLIHAEKDGAEFHVATGAPLKYIGTQKRGSIVYKVLNVQNGYLNVYLPEKEIGNYIHDAIAESVRKAR